MTRTSFLLTTLSILFAQFAFAQGWKPGQKVPSEAQVFGAPLSPEADAYLTECNVQFNEKQEKLHRDWLRTYSRYDVDFPKGVLKITRADAIVTFDIQLVGSARGKDRTWEWAWNNPGIPKAMSEASAKAREAGNKYQLPYLMRGMVPLRDAESFPWFLSGVALRNSSAVGVYRGASGDMQYFFLLFNPRESKL